MSNKNKIVFVRPQNIYGLQHYPPLGLILNATAAKKAGFKAKILIDEGESNFLDKLGDALQDSMVLGITATTSEIPNAIKIARYVKQKMRKSFPIIWGGWHSTLFFEQMEQSDLVDYVVVKEGEQGLLMAMSAIKENEKLDSKIISLPECDMDQLGSPDYDLVEDIESFIKRPLTDLFQKYYERPLRWLPYESSRGCPFKCAFCINAVTDNNRYRMKSAEKTANEMISLVEKYDLTHVKIIDDLFFANLQRVKEIFEIVEESDVEFTWDAECRVDYMTPNLINEALLAFLKKNGLVQLTYGIESGSLDTLRRMNKGGKAGPDYAIRAIKMCSDLGIASRGSFVLDIPGDTKEDLVQTVRLIRQLRKFPRFACGVHTFRPYPKSPLCEDLVAQGKFYQPETLDEWADESSIRQYTDTAAIKTWQENYKLSSKISFYESLESEFWLKPHQFNNKSLRAANNIFTKIGKIRNNLQFYGLALDKKVYLNFKDFCIKYGIHK